MRSTSTMKVSLTPDRLRTMEVRAFPPIMSLQCLLFMPRCTNRKKSVVIAGPLFRHLIPFLQLPLERTAVVLPCVTSILSTRTRSYIHRLPPTITTLTLLLPLTLPLPLHLETGLVHNPTPRLRTCCASHRNRAFLQHQKSLPRRLYQWRNLGLPAQKASVVILSP